MNASRVLIAKLDETEENVSPSIDSDVNSLDRSVNNRKNPNRLQVK